MTKSNIERIPSLIKQLFMLTNELGLLFPGRPFTPDGHLVGSIGEVLASHHYDLHLLPPCKAALPAAHHGTTTRPDFFLFISVLPSSL